MAYLHLKDYEEALSDAEAALKLDNSCIKAAYRKGLALDGLGHREGAVDAYRYVLKLQPQNKAALQKLNEGVRIHLSSDVKRHQFCHLVKIFYRVYQTCFLPSRLLDKLQSR